MGGNSQNESVTRWVNVILEFEQDPDRYLSSSESILVEIAFCGKNIMDWGYAEKGLALKLKRLERSQRIALAFWFLVDARYL